MASKANSLVRELVRLFARYDDADIAQAIDLIRGGSAFDRFSQLSEAVATRPQRRPADATKARRTRRRASDRLQLLIDELSGSKSVARKNLARLLLAAKKRQVLTSPNSVRAFSSALGLSTTQKAERAAMLLQLGEFLTEFGDDDLIAKIRSADEFETDSSLQRWANIIVRGDN